MTQQEKQQAIDLLRQEVPEQATQMVSIEPRLMQYYEHLCKFAGTQLGDPNDLHNGYELLCALKLLRLLRTYPINMDKVNEVIYDGEGEWRQDDEGFWEHVTGGLGQPGRQGAEVYRWEPFQIFMIVAMYGPQAWIPTGNYEGDRRLLDTERINEATREIEDLRRLCTDFVLFGPRKINKSGYGSICATNEFFRGDYDACIFNTANTEKQATILYEKTTDLVKQLDPPKGRSYHGKYVEYSATRTKFRDGTFRKAKIFAIPAGAKLPDGEFASWVNKDEYGSSPYVNGKSDMGATVAVIDSSMGPRREPMSLTTTTASNITAGPFMEKLDALHAGLIQELKYRTGEAEPTREEDRWMCLLLEPDDWERDEDFLFTSKELRRKINPMLGKIVQHSFYDTQISESKKDETKKNETIAKLFNVYRGLRVTKWLTGDQIRPRQIERRITDCKYSDGWNIFVGCDFSQGDDLFAITYLGVNLRSDLPADQRMFADCEVWVVEKALKESPNRPLFELWIEQGWMKVCPGEVFIPDMPINDMMAKNRQGLNLFMFGYDAAQSIQPINTIKAWLQSLGIDAPTIKKMVVPVPQTFVAQNGTLQKIEWLLLGQEYNVDTGGWTYTNDTPFLYLSSSPLWPWCFGNCKVEISSSELRAVRKAGQHSKIDPIHALIDALWLFDLSEGQVQV